MLDMPATATDTPESDEEDGYVIAFRKSSEFDSVTDTGKEVARAFDMNDCRFECRLKAQNLGCQRVKIDISTHIKGFRGPSDDFIGTTNDEFEMDKGPIIRIGKISPDAVVIRLTPRAAV